MSLELWQIVSASAGAGLAGTSAYFSPWLWRQRQISQVRREVAERRILALTYDDGPSNTVTPQLLDLLQSRAAHATFFMLGRNARRYPQIADRIVREGHDVGCHSYDHLNAWKTAPWNAVADIHAGYDQLSTWMARDAVFRPPYGKLTLPTYLALHRRGAPVWWWTLDSGDTDDKMPSPGAVADAVRREQGGIVLMHDLDRGQERNHFVLEVTDALLEVALREHFKVVALRELSK